MQNFLKKKDKLLITKKEINFLSRVGFSPGKGQVVFFKTLR